LREVRLTRKISEDDLIEVKFTKHKNRFESIVVVYCSKIGGEVHEIVRYDCAHGFFHKDLLYEKKPRKELICEGLSGELIRRIINEILCNWRELKSSFIINHIQKKGE